MIAAFFSLLFTSPKAVQENSLELEENLGGNFRRILFHEFSSLKKRKLTPNSGPKSLGETEPKG